MKEIDHNLLYGTGMIGKCILVDRSLREQDSAIGVFAGRMRHGLFLDGLKQSVSFYSLHGDKVFLVEKGECL